MSGAGKSTISERVYAGLREAGAKVEMLDGDVVRTHLSKGLGFSKEDRDTNIRRIGFVAKLLSRNGVIAIVAAISPYRAVREEVRGTIENFVEVYVHCPIEVLAERDVKGLYKRALAGEIANFTGVSDPYEAAARAGSDDRFFAGNAWRRASPGCGRNWLNWISFTLIDLHTHTTESDGTSTPRELVAMASAARPRGPGDHRPRYILRVRCRRGAGP